MVEEKVLDIIITIYAELDTEIPCRPSASCRTRGTTFCLTLAAAPSPLCIRSASWGNSDRRTQPRGRRPIGRSPEQSI